MTARRRAAAIALIAGALGARAQAPQLGALNFPTSGNAAAQPHFITGVLYLHSFEYESALKEFKESERLDPSFAMAFWGEAMTYTHPVWDEQDAPAARAALARAPQAKTGREREYLAAVNVLYGAGGKAQRDTLYSAAMAVLAKHYPDDVEAQLFYALSLLGLNQGDRDVPTYLRAGAIAESAFAHHPDHPGAAHYMIHSYDDPQHAAIALSAARAYSHIAPDAAHAQHMTSHIFLALGLWDDVVRANETSLRVVAAHSAMDPAMHGTCGHYAEWLEYGYLQQGRPSEAEKVLAGCWAVVQRTASARSGESYATMRAAYFVDDPEPLGPWPTRSPAVLDRDAADALAFGSALAAWRAGDSVSLASAIAKIDSLASAPGFADDRYLPILRREMRAMQAVQREDVPAAMVWIRAAAKLDDSLPMPFGPPATFLPPHEFAGNVLLRNGRFDSAIVEYQLALARTPRRPGVLLGLALAQAKLDHETDASKTYAELLEIWRAADPGFPGKSLAESGRARLEGKP